MPSTFSCSSTELRTQNVPARPTLVLGKGGRIEEEEGGHGEVGEEEERRLWVRMDGQTEKRWTVSEMDGQTWIQTCRVQQWVLLLAGAASSGVPR